MTPATSSPLPRELQCAYRSKFCDAPRATKLDGSLHKLCDFHRRKANANQQRLHKRKKRVLEQQQAAAGQPQPQPQTPRKRTRLSPESPQSAAERIDGNFDLLEMRILEVLLFGGPDNARQPPSMTATFKDESLVCPVSPTTPSALQLPLPAPVFHDAWSVTL